MVGLVVTLMISFGFGLALASNSSEPGVEAFSRCVFPCTLQGETLERIDYEPGHITNISKDDPRQYTVTSNSSVYTVYCIEKAGPFFLVGRTINGVDEYACLKDARYDSEDAIVIMNVIFYKPFPEKPDICEVCNGQNMGLVGFVNVKEEDCKIVIPKELDCNIPWYCPVVNSTTQKQCSRCEPSPDDGICCD